MVVLAVSGSSGSTRSDGGHSARGNGGRRWPLLHTTNLWRWLALRTVMLKMLGFAKRSTESSATMHTVDIDIIMLPFYTLLKRLSPRLDRSTNSSDTGKRQTAILIS